MNCCRQDAKLPPSLFDGRLRCFEWRTQTKLHPCSNTRCFNPQELIPVTAGEKCSLSRNFLGETEAASCKSNSLLGFLAQQPWRRRTSHSRFNYEGPTCAMTTQTLPAQENTATHLYLCQTSSSPATTARTTAPLPLALVPQWAAPTTTSPCSSAPWRQFAPSGQPCSIASNHFLSSPLALSGWATLQSFKLHLNSQEELLFELATKFEIGTSIARTFSL